jgi:hypothetical protein
MLFAGCSSCRSVVPLYCGGRFMPHVPVPVEPTAMGPTCAWCGPLPPIFTCMVCGTVQGLYLPGMTVPPAQGAGIAPLVAPAVQAPQGASPAQVHGGLKEVGLEFVRSFGKGLGDQAGMAVRAWVS